MGGSPSIGCVAYTSVPGSRSRMCSTVSAISASKPSTAAASAKFYRTTRANMTEPLLYPDADGQALRYRPTYLEVPREVQRERASGAPPAVMVASASSTCGGRRRSRFRAHILPTILDDFRMICRDLYAQVVTTFILLASTSERVRSPAAPPRRSCLPGVRKDPGQTRPPFSFLRPQRWSMPTRTMRRSSSSSVDSRAW